MKSLSFKLLFFVAAVLIAATAVAKPPKHTGIDRLKNLQIDSAVNFKTDSISQMVVFDAGSADSNMSDEISDEDITAVIDMAVAPTHSVTKTVMKTIVGVVAIVVPFAFVILVIWIICRYSTSRNRERSKLIEMSIRERVPLPDAFYKTEKSYYLGPRRLSSGIVWIGVGISVSLFFFAVGSEEMAALGLIPLFVGIARIVVYFVGKRDAGED